MPLVCSIALAEGSERSAEDNMDDGGVLLPKSNSTPGIWGYFGDRRDDVLQMQVLCKSCQTLVATSRALVPNTSIVVHRSIALAVCVDAHVLSCFK